MVTEWVECKISDACSSIDYGLTAAASNDEVDGPKFLRITDIVDGHIDWGNVPRVKADKETIEKYRLYDGDIVIARTGASTGSSIYIKDPPLAVFASYLVRLQAKKEFDPRFISYYLKSEFFWDYIRSVLGDKSAQPNASASTMTRGLLRAPKEKSLQSHIAQILGSFDDKIELNRRKSATLETMARALFKSWFVDFAPVRAKAEGRGTGLPESFGNSFTKSLKDTEIGKIPNDWSLRSLYECAQYINGAAFKAEHFSSDRKGRPIVKIGELKDGITDQTKFTVTDFEPKYKIQSGDILFSWSGSPDTSIDTFIWSGGEGWLNQHIFKIEFLRSKEKVFVFFMLKHFKPVFIEIARNKQTTGLGHVTARDLKRLMTAFPSDEVLDAFNKIALPLFGRIYAIYCEIRELEKCRNILLPKLIAGEIQVG